MIAMVSGTNGLMPQVNVFDVNGSPVAAQVIGNSNGFFSVVVANAAPSSKYYIEVSAANPSGSQNVGNYLLGIDFNASPSVPLQSFGSGTLTSSAPQESQTLAVTQAGATQFILGADAGGATGVEVQMTILDGLGNQVFQLTAWSGQPASTAVAYLTPGTYTVVYSVVAQNGVLPDSTSWNLQGWAVSDPIGPTLVTGTSGSTSTTSTPTPPSTTSLTPPPQTTSGSIYMVSPTALYAWSGPSYTTLSLFPTYTQPPSY
jgi:hypothetical protein